MGRAITSDERKAYNNYIDSNLVNVFVSKGRMWQLVGGLVTNVTQPGSFQRGPASRSWWSQPSPGVQSSVAAFNADRTRRSEKTDPRGGVTTTETVSP
jgi:hypothetical protein